MKFESILNKRTKDQSLAVVAVIAVLGAIITAIFSFVYVDKRLQEKDKEATVIFPDGQTFKAGVMRITPELRKVQYDWAIKEALEKCFTFDEANFFNQMEAAANYFPQYAITLKGRYETQNVFQNLKAYSIQTRLEIDEINYSYDDKKALIADVKAFQTSIRPKSQSRRNIHLRFEVRDMVSVNNMNPLGVQFFNVEELDFSPVK